MDKAEPPSAPRANSLFRIGKNRRGQWVVQDQSGLCRGLFVSRAEAVKFAMFENGNRPQAVIMVPGILELDMSGNPRASGASSIQVHRGTSGLTIQGRTSARQISAPARHAGNCGHRVAKEDGKDEFPGTAA
jgi:hypothetical protein